MRAIVVMPPRLLLPGPVVQCCLLLASWAAFASSASQANLLPGLLATCNATLLRSPRVLSPPDCAVCMQRIDNATTNGSSSSTVATLTQQRMAGCHTICQDPAYFPPSNFTYKATALACSNCLTSPSLLNPKSCQRCMSGHSKDVTALGQCFTCLEKNPAMWPSDTYDRSCSRCASITNSSERSSCFNCLFKGIRTPDFCVATPSIPGHYRPLNVAVASAMTWQGYNTQSHEAAFLSLIRSFVTIGSTAVYSSCSPSHNGSLLTSTFQLSSQKKVDSVLSQLLLSSDAVAVAARSVVCGSTVSISGGSLHSGDRIAGIVYSCSPPAQKKRGWKYISSVLCCASASPPSGSPPSSGGRHLSQASSPSSASCPNAGLRFPGGGSCPYTTGMVVYCSNLSNLQGISTYYRIFNGIAVPYSPLGYVLAGSPMPAFSTSECCSFSGTEWVGVLNGCAVSAQTLTASDFGIAGSGTLFGWNAAWSNLPSPMSLSANTLLVSSNGNFALYMSSSGYVPMLTLAATAPSVPSTLNITNTFSYWSQPWPMPAASSISGSAGSLQMNSDGNLVFTSSTNAVLWQSGTSNKGTGPYTLSLLNDGCLVVTDIFYTTIWNSSTTATQSDNPNPGLSTVLHPSPLTSGSSTTNYMNSPNCGGTEDHECGGSKLSVGLRSPNGQFVFRLSGHFGRAQVVSLAGGIISGGQHTAQFLSGLVLDDSNVDYASDPPEILWTQPTGAELDSWGNCNTTLSVMDAGYWQIALTCGGSDTGATGVHFTSNAPQSPAYPPYSLYMQDDGNCVLQDSRSTVVWSTGVPPSTKATFFTVPDGALKQYTTNAPAAPGAPPSTCQLPIGSVLYCPPSPASTSTLGTMYLITSGVNSQAYARPFTTAGYQLAQSPQVTFNVPLQWCGTAVVAGCNVVTDAGAVPGLLPEQFLQSFQLCSGISPWISCMSASTSGTPSGSPALFTSCATSLCPVSTTTLSAYIADDTDNALYFSLQLSPSLTVTTSPSTSAQGCGFGIVAGAGGGYVLQYLVAGSCNSALPQQQFFVQAGAPGVASSTPSYSNQYPPATWFTISSPYLPGYCLTNTSTFITCNPNDPSQQMSTFPVISSSSTFTMTTGNVVTLGFQAPINTFMGNLFGAFNNAFGLNDTWTLNTGAVATSIAATFPSTNIDGAAGTATVTFAPSASGPAPLAMSLQSFRQLFLGTMYTQYNSSGGYIPATSVFAAAPPPNEYSDISTVQMTVSVEFTLNPTSPQECPAKRSLWENIVAAVVVVTAAVVTGGAAIAATAATAAAVGTGAAVVGGVVAGGFQIASAVCSG